MTREEALAIAEGLREDRAGLHEIADAIFNAWSNGLGEGDLDGYGRGYTDGFTDAGRVGE